MIAARLFLFLAAALVASSAVASSGVQGARGLDDWAEAASATCRDLAETWRNLRSAPGSVEIAGEHLPVVDLSRHGVVPERDSRRAMQKAFDAETSPVVFLLPPNSPGDVYLRSRPVTLSLSGAVLCGYGATLSATNDKELGLGIMGNRIGVFGLTFTAPPSAFADWPERWEATQGREMPEKFPSGGTYGAWASHLVIDGATDVLIRDVTMLGAMRGGIRMYGVSNALVEGVCVYRSLSDGIHIVHGSEHVTVRQSRVIETGDDCISVVSYDRDRYPLPVRDVLISDNLCQGSRTRGLTVIGGEDVVIEKNQVSDTLMAGILLYPEPGINSHRVRNVTVQGNRLDGASLRRDRCGNCGDVVVNSAGRGPGMVEEIHIGENIIRHRAAGAGIRLQDSCERAWD